MLLLKGEECLFVGEMVGKSLLGHEYAADVGRGLLLYCFFPKVRKTLSQPPSNESVR